MSGAALVIPSECGTSPRRPALADHGSAVLEALDQRLREAARVLSPERFAALTAAGSSTADLLTGLVATCRESRDPSAAWLLLVALTAAFPSPAQVERVMRTVKDRTPDASARDLLSCALRERNLNRFAPSMDIVESGAVVEVDFCARHNTHSGIQRLVRELAPRWSAAHDVQLTVWTAGFEAMRTPGPHERGRVLTPPSNGDSTLPAHRDDADVDRLHIVVPWGVPVVLPDVPAERAADALTAIGQYSPNDVVVVGYDLIPVTDAGRRPPSETETFVRWLRAVKHARLVATISESARVEFAGFASMVSAQGLAGPDVVAVTIAENPLPPQSRHDHTDRPVVVVPGRREPHKNQRLALHAAEVLWGRGLDFEVRMIGGPGWTPGTVEATIARLKSEGWPLTVLGWVDDETQWREFAQADVAVFASLHEGYGLSVTECLAFGVPTITTCYGSQAEIAAGGGCLTVDPRDDRAMVDALAELLTDPARRDTLRAEALARHRRTWDEYAEDLWQTVAGLGVSA